MPIGLQRWVLGARKDIRILSLAGRNNAKARPTATRATTRQTSCIASPVGDPHRAMREVCLGSCVTSITGPNGGAELYER
jgi:hypothetical protein